MTLPGNFAFLHDQWPELHASATEAETLTYSAPRSSAFTCRYTMEQAVNWAYAADPALERPYRDNLASLIHEATFKQLLPADLFPSLLYVLKTGNLAAHGDPKRNPITRPMALLGVKHLHAFLQWFAIFYGDPRPQTALFDESAVPQVDRPEKTADRLSELQSELERAKIRLRRHFEENQQLRAEVQAAKARNASTVHAASFKPDDATEAATRTCLIDVMLKEAGWDLTEKRDREYEVTGMPNETGLGYVDYVLWDADGSPLAVVEAKRSSKSPEQGRHQAKLYADCIERMHGRRPVIFYTNGYELFIWDDRQYPPRRLLGFYTRDELRWLIRQRDERQSITGEKPNPKIVERHYQLEAIQRVAEALTRNERRALLVMATGTGKTRTAIALVDVLMRAGWVRRVLFLADRNALVKQAKDAFTAHLPSVPVAKFSGSKVDDKSRVVISTYPTMLNAIDELGSDDTRAFSVAAFDLIIIDEAHRSIYRKYGSIFDYFDSLVIGLTATPKNEVDRNTYEFFQLEDEVPTAAYELSEAVNDGYLVPFKNMSVPIKFPREGIKYEDLSEEEKRDYEEKFYDDETEELPDFIESGKINDWVLNADTVDKVLQCLMENGLKVNQGDRLGKTIIFARNHRHAEFIAERFDILYPDKKGSHLRVVDNQIKFAQNLIDDFGVKEKEPVITVSVDMLDTGIDVPEILNLVFFKIVRSKAKFWQMIGRGTRLCKDLFAPGEDKKEFLILDFCENFEFFGENPEGIIARSQQSLTERIFNRRLSLSQLLRHADYQNDTHKTLRRELLDTLCSEAERIQSVRGQTIAVRKELQYFQRFAERTAWEALSELEVTEIRNHIAPLSFTDDKDDTARRFDLLTLNLSIAVIEMTPAETRLQDQVVSVADYLYVNSMNIPAVSAKRDTIVKIRQDEFWKDVRPCDVEWIRKELRGLVQFIETSVRNKVVRTDFEDALGEVAEGPDLTYGAFDALKYKDRVESFIRQHQDHLVINKIRFNEPITTAELRQIERLLEEASVGSPEQIRQAFGIEDPLALLVRRIVGLDIRAAKEAFAEYLRKHPSLNAAQMRFINRLIDHLSKNGYIDPERLVDIPYTDFHPNGIFGVFPDSEVSEIRSILKDVRRRAETG